MFGFLKTKVLKNGSKPSKIFICETCECEFETLKYTKEVYRTHDIFISFCPQCDACTSKVKN